jgi:toxin ParE1/3/4
MPGRELPIVYSLEADEDLIQIWRYLAREASERVADAQLHEIDKVCARLSAQPYSGRTRNELLLGMRSALASPYLVFYRIGENAIEVIRVLHGRRDIASIFAERSSDG